MYREKSSTDNEKCWSLFTYILDYQLCCVDITKTVFCTLVNHCILVLKVKFYPRIFPFIRHWYNVHVEKMHPLKVTSLEAGGWRFGLVTISLEPFLNHVVVKLFTPQQTSICLSRHLSLLLVFHGNFLKKSSSPFFPLNIVSLVTRKKNTSNKIWMIEI